MQEEPEFEVDYYVPDFESLYEFANQKQVHFWIQKWREMRYYDEPDSSVRDWFDNLKKFHGPRVIGQEECIMAFNLFLAKSENLPRKGSYVRQGDSCPPSHALWVKKAIHLQTCIIHTEKKTLKLKIFTQQKSHASSLLLYCRKNLIVTSSTNYSIRTNFKQYNPHVSCLSIHAHAHRHTFLVCFFLSCFLSGASHWLVKIRSLFNLHHKVYPFFICMFRVMKKSQWKWTFTYYLRLVTDVLSTLVSFYDDV